MRFYAPDRTDMFVTMLKCRRESDGGYDRASRWIRVDACMDRSCPRPHDWIGSSLVEERENDPDCVFEWALG